MADKVVSSPVVAVVSGTTGAVSTGTPKKTVKSKQPRVKPKSAEMVIAAITALKERGGSSLQAIKKYIAGTYKVDVDKQATFIKKYLKAAVESGVLVQTKGKGAAGSFKLAATKGTSVKSKAKAAPKKAPVAKKPALAKKPVSAGAKKALPKKAVAKAVTEKKGPAAKPKSKTAKAKPAVKSPIKKAKPAAKKAKPAAPKAKKAVPKKVATAKK